MSQHAEATVLLEFVRGKWPWIDLRSIGISIQVQPGKCEIENPKNLSVVIQLADVAEGILRLHRSPDRLHDWAWVILSAASVLRRSRNEKVGGGARVTSGSLLAHEVREQEKEGSGEVMHIEISALRAITDELLSRIEQRGIKAVELNYDYYWSIPAKLRYDTYDEPSEFNMGQLSEDLAFVNEMLSGVRPPVSYGLVWISSLLRYIGETVPG